MNIDGVEWARQKYNRIEQRALLALTLLSEVTASNVAIDSRAMMKYVPPSLRRKTFYAPNGVEITEREGVFRGDLLDSYKLRRLSFWLVIARLEPENNIHKIIEGYAASQSTKPLVIVGNPTSKDYMQRLRAVVASHGLTPKVIFTGGIYDPTHLYTLRNACFAYVHGHSVGGTNPSLLEIMARGKIIVAFDTPFNREVGGDSLLYFRSEAGLSEVLRKIDIMAEEYDYLRARASNRVREYYSWDKIMMTYNAFFKSAQKP